MIHQCCIKYNRCITHFRIIFVSFPAELGDIIYVSPGPTLVILTPDQNDTIRKSSSSKINIRTHKLLDGYHISCIPRIPDQHAPAVGMCVATGLYRDSYIYICNRFRFQFHNEVLLLFMYVCMYVYIFFVVTTIHVTEC